MLLAALSVAAVHAQTETGLDRYVAAPDPAFGWELSHSDAGAGFGIFDLRLTSQSWRSRADVTPVVWEHWLRIFVPFSLSRSTAVLLLDGGSRDEDRPDSMTTELGLAAVRTGAVVAELRAIPNQPLQFTDEARTRSEDAILAYSWDKFLRSGDETWPAMLPMTKAAVRAMDAVQEFMQKAPAVGPYTIKDFIVAGGSKRGWTTWLTAAEDSRVRAIIPLVFDALNMEESFKHHWRSYGTWSPAVHDYEELGIFAWLGSRQTHELLASVDPYSYLDRLTMPKYLINAAGDEFFVNTSSQFYFDDLQGPKYLRYVPNSRHNLGAAAGDVLVGAVTWALRVMRDGHLPEFSWEFPSPGRIVVSSVDEPNTVRLWQAHNPDARDFRVDTLGDKAWTSTVVTASADGSFEANVLAPGQGYTAFFLEMSYSGEFLLGPLVFTTPVRVVPDTLPFGPPLAARLAASYDPLTAADAIVSVFGEELAAETAAATTLPLPTELARASVRVTDANGVIRLCGLFYVSEGQVNFLLPAGAFPGVAKIEVLRDGQWVAGGQILIEDLAPGLFSANGTGEGVAAAVAQPFVNGVAQEATLVFDGTAPQGSREPEPIRLHADQQLYLLLFGTGMRNGVEVTATVGGLPVGVLGPAPSSEFEGLDQLNLGPLPLELAGSGEVEIRVVIDGVAANVVTVTFL